MSLTHLFRRLLERSLPAEVGDGIVGDLDEVYRARRGRAGAVRADLWYAGQALAISARFTAERMRGAASSAVSSAAASSVGLDLKLGVRMLFKYPMLTLVGVVAITVTIAVGVGTSEFLHDLFVPRLPFADGDRIVRVVQLDAQNEKTLPASLYDLSVWRASLSSVQELGAYTTLEQGLVSDRGTTGTVSLARMSASGFRITGVGPLLGRELMDADERPDAPPVVLLGYDAWQTLLGGDANPIGRIVQLGGTATTVVGVMPEGYGFPESQNAWVPLRADPADLQPAAAPRATVFGRLAPGATLESAQSELGVLGRRAAAALPDVYGRLTPKVDAFARRASGLPVTLIASGVGLLFIFLLAVVCSNVATLVFARTVIREGEIAIRRSLGATRSRIVLQLLTEAVVLVGVATALGIAVARFALGPIARLFFIIQQEPRPPFWWDDALSSTTVGYAVVLALVGALVIGVVPALKATGGSMQPRLGQLSAGGGGGLRFGGMWTVVIVLQVALSVAFLPLAVSQARQNFADQGANDFAADEYLTAQLGRDAVVPPRTPEARAAYLAESRRLFDQVKERLAADPAVRGVAFASGLSAMNHVGLPFELSGDGSRPPISAGARVLLVDPSYLDLMGATLVAGRPLGPGDYAPESRSVLVNQAFVDQVLGGRNPVGAQVRFAQRRGEESSLVTLVPPGSSVDIVGVVRNPEIDVYGPGAHAAIYAPIDLAPVDARAAGLVGMPDAPVTQLFVRTRGDVAVTASRLYAIVASVDPTLRLSELGTAADAWGPVHTGNHLGGWILIALAGMVLMLSVAGIYALMSFTVSQRTREIAIRTAIGAGRPQILRVVFGRAAVQLLIGVALGSAVAVPVLLGSASGARTVLIVAVVLGGAGLAACLIPVRRAMGIQPAVAMKGE